jgi:hypothetical protein
MACAHNTGTANAEAQGMIVGIDPECQNWVRRYPQVQVDTRRGEGDVGKARQ